MRTNELYTELTAELMFGPAEDPMSVAARQIAEAVSRQQSVTPTELETLKQWCVNQLQKADIKRN